MSLLYWLPLINDAHNQGLNGDTTTIMGSGITYTPGKLGNAATFPNNANSCLNLPGLQLQTGSWCAWIKCNGEGAGAYQYVISEGRDAGSIGTNFWMAKAGTTLYARSHKVNITYTNFPLNVWTHICMTFGNNKLSLYINGQFISEIAYTDNTDYAQSNNRFVIGKMAYTYTNTSNYFPFNGQINDVRVYDHCLSDKEIKEIAKGLVLHYKLDDRYVETTTNLCNGLKTGGRTTLQNNIISTTGENADTYWYVKTSTPLTAGTTYTLSLECSGLINDEAFWRFGVGAQNGDKCCGNFTIKNGYNVFTFILPQGLDGATQIILDDNNRPNWEDIASFYNIQLEEKDHATGYAGMSGTRTESIIYDCSGYGNNGTATLITVSSDSARYSNNVVFSGSTSYIKVTDNNWMAQHASAMTINLWAKASSWPANSRLFSCTESGGFNTEGAGSGYWRFPVYVCTNAEQTSYAYKYDNKELQLSALPTNEWVMLTFIYDSTGTRTYINGQLHHTYTNTSYGIRFNTSARLFLGCEASGANAASPWFKGEESDFRLYYTALTEEQIQELYHTPMSIDNKGNIYTRELVEV